MNNAADDRIIKFLLRHGLHESCFDFEAHVRRFTEEMDNGLAGDTSSLLMLPTYLDDRKGGGMKDEVIAIDAGGTNLRIGLVKFSPGEPPERIYYEKQPIPGAGTPVDKTVFFDRIAAALEPVAGRSGKIGFCFSFPTDILPSRDGRILIFDKEVKVTDGAGSLLGQELNDALARAGKPAASVTVLNDSTAAILGVLAFEQARIRKQEQTYSGHIGLIYGTGVNICYSECIDRIPKLKKEDIPQGSRYMLINTEAGGYAGFERGPVDREMDETSEDPGGQLFEKMVSGAYFSVLVLRSLKLAANEGLFSEAAAARIAEHDRLDPADIDRFLKDPGGRSTLAALCLGENDSAQLFSLIDGLYDRAAKLVAIVVAAVMIRCGGGTADAPILLVVDGSTFHKGYRFRERFVGMIEKYTDSALHYELVGSEDHTLIGAAASVFM
ncbi:hexokinase [Clostridia bacterium]|nr:hexokinase [Clostridia bacterium]